MKIAFIVPPSLYNIGNGFIHYGAEILLKSIPKIKLQKFVMQNSSDFVLVRYPTEYTFELNERLMEDCDCLIFAGGSCFNPSLKSVFKQMSKFKGKKIVMGGSFFGADAEELGFYKNVFNYMDYVFTRDQKTYDLLPANDKKILGLDCALWLKDAKERIKVLADEPYAVVNIDSPQNRDFEQAVIGECGDYKKIYLTRHGLTDKKVFEQNECRGFVSEDVWDYIRLYANAGSVVTNRVHTFVVCALFNVPCRFIVENSAWHPRYSLLEHLGISVEQSDCWYTDYTKFHNVLEKKKRKMKKELTKAIHE